MGFSASWVAVRGLAIETAAEALGLEITGEISPEPEGDISLASLANGWTLIWFGRDFEAAFKTPAITLARHGPAVACAVEEHVMFSEARGYADGVESWRVTWDCENEGGEPVTSGKVPAAYAAILAAAIEEQAQPGNEGVDLLWDVPPEVAKSICGFRHDEDLPDGLMFVELLPAGRSRVARDAPGHKVGGGFWRRLFGGR